MGNMICGMPSQPVIANFDVPNLSAQLELPKKSKTTTHQLYIASSTRHAKFVLATMHKHSAIYCDTTDWLPSHQGSPCNVFQI
jgi:hypothetical protein